MIPTVLRMTEAQITETAREIVTNQLMIADLSQREWQDSLALLFSMVEDRGGTIGMILVPMGPHLRGYWINNRAPAVTWECRCVHRNDVERLRSTIEGMLSALHPDHPRLFEDGETRKEPHEQRRRTDEDPGDQPVHDHPT